MCYKILIKTLSSQRNNSNNNNNTLINEDLFKFIKEFRVFCFDFAYFPVFSHHAVFSFWPGNFNCVLILSEY